MTVYLDGVSLGNPTPGSAADQSADVLIGAEGSIGSPLSEFDGVLDDVRVYSDDLTAAEAAALAGLGPPFDVTLAFNSISGDVATVGVTFERAPQSFVLGNVTVSNGTTSNLSGSGTSYTFDVTGTAALVTISIAAAALQDAGDNNNSASNTLTFIAPSFSAGGLKQFDRTDTSETITGSILVGPIRLAPSVAGKGLVQEAYVVLGRDSNAAGTFEFVIGQDGEDSVYRAENSLATYSVTIATLQANSGLCYPRVAGSALTLRIAQTSGHLIFEEASLSVRPHGRNRLVKK